MPVVTIPALGQYGLVADQPAQELPVNAFSNTLNVRFANGIAERFAGETSIFTNPSVTPYWIAPYSTSGKRYWVHAGLSAIFADDGTTRATITGTAPTGGIDDRWSGGVLNGVFFMNNGVDVPRTWAGSGNTASLANWNANWRCQSLGAYKNYLVALNITKSGTKYQHMVKWSSAADPGAIPGSWDEADPTKDAGEIDLAETPDLIVDQLVLGEVNIIYKEQSMYSMQYVGGDFIFSFKRLPGNYGMLARGCAANTPKGHVVLANGDVILHQGQGEPQSLLTARLKRWLFSTQIDTANYKRCFVTANPTKNEVWICYPSLGKSACDRALIWNWVDNTFSVRELQNATYGASGLLDYTKSDTYDASTDTYDTINKAYNQNDYTPADSRLILTTTKPDIVLADVGSLYGSTPINALLERTGLAFDDPDTVKTIKSITPRINAVTGTVVNIQLGGSMDAETPPTWSDPIPYTVGSSFKAFGFASGRFLAYRISGTGRQPFAVKSIDVDLVTRGAY